MSQHLKFKMVKAKLRLAIITVVLILLPIVLYLINISFGDNLISSHEFGEEYRNVHRRKLDQHFEWHSAEEEQIPDSAILDPGEKDNSTSSKKVLSTCRNSVQGKSLIADDRGYVCKRFDLLATGCCNNSNGTVTTRYACGGCQQATGCCMLYEHCISCCMDPDNKGALMTVLKEANLLSNILLLSVSDHFELCLAKCRTSSRSVQHENLYINPGNKYCYSKGPMTTTISSQQAEEKP